MIANNDESDDEDEASERIDTLSTAPTVLVGYNDTEDRLLDVRPPSHIPGKRRAPKPPPSFNKGAKASVSKATGESNYERLGNFAKVNKIQRLDGEEQAQDDKGNLSPRSWFRKNKKDMTIPNNGLSKSKSSSNNSARPISLLASISDFDREAAKIVEQRLKDEEKRKRVNDESFYVSASDVKNKKEPQQAIDEIMAHVEQKMECLDAIGKHNSRWEKRISHDIPNIDMNGLVSDLNHFLNTTKRELMTPRSKRKQEILMAKQMEEEENLKRKKQKELMEVHALLDECKQAFDDQDEKKPDDAAIVKKSAKLPKSKQTAVAALPASASKQPSITG